MTTPVFDVDAFKTAQKNQFSGDFPEIDPGYYIAELLDAKVGKAKTSDRLQATFHWQISDDDEQFANQHCWDRVGLTDGEGVTNQQGYNIFCMRLSQLGVSTDEFLADNQRVLDSIAGTKARIQVKKAESGGKTFTNIWIDNVISSPLDNTKPDYSEDDFENLETKDLKEEAKLEIVVGTKCLADGKLGKIKYFDKAAGKVLVDLNEGGQNLYDARQIEVITDESTPKKKENTSVSLRKDQFVNALFNGTDGEMEITGKIHDFTYIDDSAENKEIDKVKILVQGSDGEKDKLYPCQPENVRLIF